MASFKAYKFDPLKTLDIELPKNTKKEALEEVAAYLKEELLSYAGEAKSIVSGGQWVKGLTKEYKALKSEISSNPIANLELNGDLLDSLDVKVVGNKIEIDVAEDQKGKALGHISGEYGTNSRIRPRQFMPQGNETFKQAVLSNIKNILKEFESE